MIRRPQPRRSFGQRLSRALTATSVGAILLVCLVLSLLYSINLRNETIAALELQTRIVGDGKSSESRAQRIKRHAAEVADSHEKLRASVAETDRLIVASNEMIRRHRREDEEAGD